MRVFAGIIHSAGSLPIEFHIAASAAQANPSAGTIDRLQDDA
jgi:hypothetical protein